MNLREIDLNLLVVLEVLLSERHVTRAGQRLGLSQPATSNALERLRDLFGDPLLERTRDGLRPTPRAEAIEGELREVLRHAARLIERSRPGAHGIDLASLEQTVRFSVVDYGLPLFLPRVLRALRESAPGIDLAIAPWAGADDALAGLRDGTLDLALSVHTPSVTDLRWQVLFEERYVVAMRRDHPARRRFDLERWLAHPHVVVSGRGQSGSPLDGELARRGLSRRVGLVVPSFLAVPPILAGSDLLALVPAHLIDAAGRQDVVTRPPPLAVPGFEVSLAWHRRRDGDAATRHVRQLLSEVAGELTRKSVTARERASPSRS